jgi:hypothetical protein
MAIMIYHHNMVVSTACFEQVSGKWKYAATVSWSESGCVTRSHFVTTSSELFDRFEDAEKAGIEAAKNWVEQGRKTSANRFLTIAPTSVKNLAA